MRVAGLMALASMVVFGLANAPLKAQATRDRDSISKFEDNARMANRGRRAHNHFEVGFNPPRRAGARAFKQNVSLNLEDEPIPIEGDVSRRPRLPEVISALA